MGALEFMNNDSVIMCLVNMRPVKSTYVPWCSKAKDEKKEITFQNNSAGLRTLLSWQVDNREPPKQCSPKAPLIRCNLFCHVQLWQLPLSYRDHFSEQLTSKFRKPQSILWPTSASIEPFDQLLKLIKQLCRRHNIIIYAITKHASPHLARHLVKLRSLTSCVYNQLHVHPQGFLI